MLHNKISIHAYKYDGWLYRSWEFPTIIKETNEYLCVSSHNARVITASKKQKNRFFHSQVTYPTIWFFFKRKWYNIIVSYRDAKYYCYINIASPYIFEEDTIKYVDLDLDFRIPNLKQPIIKELDVSEFKTNAKLYQYPEKLIVKIKEAESEIYNLFSQHKLEKLMDLSLLKLIVNNSHHG
jgi:protein associated with RNAse G/E